MKRPVHARFMLPILALFAVLTPWVVRSAMRAMEQSSNQVSDWLPEAFESTRKMAWFAEHFVSDDLLLISWEGCCLTDDRLLKLAAELRQPTRLGNHSPQILARAVLTGPDMLAQLRGEPLNLSKQVALRRLQGWLVGDDLQQTGLVVLLAKAGWANRHAFLQHIYESAEREIGIQPDRLFMAGSTADSVAIDAASEKHLQWMMVACYVTSCLLMRWMFRDSIQTASVFLTALFCQQLSLALIEVTGGHVDSVMLMIPSLLYVLSVSAGVHLVNYYRDDFGAGPPETAVSRAVRHAQLPCVLAALTTALGLSSLSVSVLNPVKNFGLYAAFGVLAAVPVIFSLLPAILQNFSMPVLAKQAPREEPIGETINPWDSLVDWIGRYRAWVLSATVLLMAGCAWGILQIRTSVGVHDLLAADAKLIQDYDALEHLIGPLVPLEVVVRLPATGEANRVSLVDRLRIVGAIHGTIEKCDGIGAVVSALNFSPSLTRRKRGLAAAAREAVLENQLSRNLENLQQLAYLSQTDQEQLWRISARAYAGQRRNYSQLLAELQALVAPVLARNQQRPGLEGIEAVYCGGVPLVQQTQEQMLQDLIKSFVLAFVMIAGMMVLLMLVGSSGEWQQLEGLRAKLIWAGRRALAGLVAMVPNVMPCVIVLGGMGMLNFRLGIGSIMTASVALGIAVDDTLHFITWFRRGLQQGQPRATAVRFAVHRCATAMTQTSLICGFGLLIFSMSEFVPIARFAWVMFGMLLMALLADLLVLPALLLSPLGTLFEPVSPRLPGGMDE